MRTHWARGSLYHDYTIIVFVLFADVALACGHVLCIVATFVIVPLLPQVDYYFDVRCVPQVSS